MAVDPAFLGAGQKPGIKIWRIEKLKVVEVDEKTYGDYYTGDSYIVLKTVLPPGKNALKWDIHFWLGSETSQDECGVAAFKTVELDDLLGGGPVQHREVQGHESSLFLSYFKKGVKYLAGGVDSGFRKVERGKYETRLLHLKGKRNVRCQQVVVALASLNTGDVFILDAGLTIFVWNGVKSSRQERIKGMEVARQIRDGDRQGRAKVIVVEPEQSSYHPQFFKALGVDPKTTTITIAEDTEDDAEYEGSVGKLTILSRVCDASGRLEVEVIATNILKRSYLDTNDCFILEAGRSGIFVWVGKNCTEQEKKGAWAMALDFIGSKGYPNWTKVTRVVEGGETALFKQCFKEWPDQSSQVGFGQTYNVGKVAKVEQQKIDARVLHQRNEHENNTENLPDDGTGDVQIWRIQQFQMVEIPKDMYGIFFGGDSYIIRYEYQKRGRTQTIIYFWQGTMSSTDERGAAAMLAQQMDEQHYHGMAQVVRVSQNKEPEHFLRIFKGRMLVFKGGTVSGFRNRREMDQVDEEKVMLFHVRGTNEYNTKAMQVSCRAAALNSNDVFVLVASTFRTFVWKGVGANDDERNVAVYVAQNLTKSSDIEIFDEEDESDEFWEELGGREPYATGGVLSSTEHSNYPPRLFQCSNASGRFEIDEIIDYAQEDLCEDDVMLLDTYDEIFVWVGRGANDTEKKEAMTTAIEYLDTDPSGRTQNTTSIYQVKMGSEPINFTAHFHAWEPDIWQMSSSYEQMKQELVEENAKVTLVVDELQKYSSNNTYSYSKLTKQPPWPEGVDPSCREKYLSEEEFQSVFKMSKQDFETLKPWKQISLRKAANLF